MAGFLYQVRGGGGRPSLEAIRSWGLGYAFEREPEVRDTVYGPLFGDPDRLAGVGFMMKGPEEQTWRRMVTLPEGSPEIWIGWYHGDPPGPEVLARKEQLTGWELTMADRRKWVLPLVSRFDEKSEKRLPMLPAYYDIDEAGQLTIGDVEERYRWLWDLTQPAWDAMISGGDVTDQEALATAGGLLSANYVVNAMELVCLHAFSPTISPAGVVSLAIDYVTWKQWSDAIKKKTESRSPGESAIPNAGPAACSPGSGTPGLT